MISTLLHLASSAALCIVVIVLLVNGIVLVVAPQSWFKMPRWLRGGRQIQWENYNSRMGLFKLRIVGVLVVTTLVWIAYDVLVAR